MSKNQTITGETVRLDYATLRNTDYQECTLVYGGGVPPNLINCNFKDCEFVLEGPALNTVRFLKMLAEAGAADMVLRDMIGIHPQGGENE